MLAICCNNCHEQLTSQSFRSYAEADETRLRVGHPTGEITRHGEAEVLCRRCYAEYAKGKTHRLAARN